MLGCCEYGKYEDISDERLYKECKHGNYDCAGVFGTITKDNYYRCGNCWKDRRTEELKAGKVSPLYVCVYRITRNYGGPEEGGWWYDNTVIEEVRKAWSWQELLRQARIMKKEYPKEQYSRYSMLGNRGDVFMKLCYDVSQFPSENTSKPRYE